MIRVTRWQPKPTFKNWHTRPRPICKSLAQTTSADIQDLARATKADIQELARATKTKDDIQDLARATAADIAAVRADFKTELKDLELRLEQRLNRQTIQLAGLAIAAGGVVVAILKWFP